MREFAYFGFLIFQKLQPFHPHADLAKTRSRSLKETTQAWEYSTVILIGIPYREATGYELTFYFRPCRWLFPEKMQKMEQSHFFGLLNLSEIAVILLPCQLCRHQIEIKDSRPNLIWHQHSDAIGILHRQAVGSGLNFLERKWQKIQK